jgi:deoxyribonuclease V
MYIQKECELKLDFVALAKEQENLAKLVRRYDDPPYNSPIVIAVDVAYTEEVAAGCAVLFNNNTKEIIDSSTIIRYIDSDYVPGFFQLREGPIIVELVRSLRAHGIVLVDGNGILHPRRFGLASYLGVKLDVQTIGVAKKLMLGEIGLRSEDSAEVREDEEVLGRALWLKKKPIYVSIGHRVSLESAVKVVIDSSIHGYPEALRQAHRLSKEVLRKKED